MWRLKFEVPGSFPSQEAAIKLIYLALRNVSKKWHTVQGWREALRQFTIRWPYNYHLIAKKHGECAHCIAGIPTMHNVLRVP